MIDQSDNKMGRCWGITKKLSRCNNNAGSKRLCSIHKAQPRYFAISGGMVIILGIIASYVAGLIPAPWTASNETPLKTKQTINGNHGTQINENKGVININHKTADTIKTKK
jgi:hypothetical protein